MTTTSTSATRQKIIDLLEPVCAHAGVELVDLRLVMEPGGWVLRVYIDRPGHGIIGAPRPDGVSIADCEALSREFSALLDVSDPIPQAFSLEVSSPGVDRPLRTPEHFRNFAGAEAKITLAVPLVSEQGERRNFRGVLGAVADGGDVRRASVTMRVDGHDFVLPIADIDQARLVPNWDAVMRGENPYLTEAPSASKTKPQKRVSNQ